MSVRRRSPTDLPILSLFGRLLAKARDEAGLTLDDLAARTGIHRNSISDLENGLDDPDLTTVVDLACAMRIDPAALLRPLIDLSDQGEGRRGGHR